MKLQTKISDNNNQKYPTIIIKARFIKQTKDFCQKNGKRIKKMPD